MITGTQYTLEEIQEYIINPLAIAILRISEGDNFKPSGLESIAISIAGEKLNFPIGESINNVADSLNNISESIDDLKNVLQKLLKENTKMEL